MPRGRPLLGPPTSLSAPRRPDDPDALIDAALQGLAHDARVRTTWPKRPVRGSWIDATNRPKPPHARGRPTTHSLQLLARAVALLQTQQWWTRYHATRYVVDRCLVLRVTWQLPWSVLGIPPHVVAERSGVAQHVAARRYLMNRLKQTC